jgi:BON domain-containing protein
MPGHRQLKPLLQRMNAEVPGLLQEASQTAQNDSRVTGHVGFVFVKAQDRGDDDAFDAVKQEVSQSLQIARWFMRFGKYLIVRKVRDWLNRLLRSPCGFNSNPTTVMECDGSYAVTNERRDTMKRFLLNGGIVLLSVSLLAGCQTMPSHTEDARITAAIKSKLAEEQFDLSRVGVDTGNAHVYLSGVVPSADHKARVEQIANGELAASPAVNGSVINRLQVRPVISDATVTSSV